MAVANETRWGTLWTQEIIEPPNSRATTMLADQGEVEQAVRHIMRPAYELQLPELTHLTFDCFKCGDGNRRFVPHGSMHKLFLHASAIGQAILFQIKDMTAEQRYSYSAMRLIYQLGPRLRERFNRQFGRIQDLMITAAVESDRRSRDVLPEDIGQENETEEYWSVPEFVERGRQAAIAGGNRQPDEATCIRFAIREAAKLNPFNVNEMTEAQARATIRLGLFDLGPSVVSIEPEIRDRVIDRLLSAISRHREDSQEDFDSWFYKTSDTVVRQVSKQTKGGGPIDRDVVRQVRLETVFKSFFYVADTAQLAFEAFRQAIPNLTEVERIWFEAFYFRRPSLGGLPLALLYDRNGLFDGLIVDCVNDPANESKNGILLKALYIYHDMANARRRADRELKRLRAGQVENISSIQDYDVPGVS